TVSLQIPESLGFQLVYRQEFRDPLPVPERQTVNFVFLTSPAAALQHLSLLRSHFMGWPGSIKALAKLPTGRRVFYLVHQDGRVASTGWCTIGRCRYYPVEPGAVVIGPIWSAEEFRGQGLAPYALKKAINLLVGHGHHVFYI